MVFWLIIIVELLILFISSQFIFKALFAILSKAFRSQHAAMVLVFTLFMPGVVIHELAHFFAAGLLFVRAHDLEVAPKITGGSLQMGSVQIEKTDIVRRMVIGVAPILLGSAFLLAVLFYFVNNLDLSDVFMHWSESLKIILATWVTFFVTNTMFSSKKDVEGALEFVALAVFLGLVMAIFTTILKIDLLSPALMFLSAPVVTEKVKLLVILFSIPVGINLFVCVLGRIILRKIY